MQADVTKRWSNANKSKMHFPSHLRRIANLQHTSLTNDKPWLSTFFWQVRQNHWYNSNHTPNKSGDLEPKFLDRKGQHSGYEVWCLPSDGRHCPRKLHHAQKHWDEGLGDLIMVIGQALQVLVQSKKKHHIASSHGSWEVSDYGLKLTSSTHWFIPTNPVQMVWVHLRQAKNLFSGASNLRTCFNNSWQRYGGFGNLVNVSGSIWKKSFTQWTCCR